MATDALDSAASDRDLLARYAAGRDPDALAALVRRHFGFVYAAARRQVGGDAHLAEDVAQAVFILLARKAHRIRADRGRAAVTAWLFAVTRYAAANARKMQARRLHHEQRAAAALAAERPAAPADAAASFSPNDARADLLPMLDEAIARLPANERRGVLLAFFQRLTYREAGAAMGVSEDAARKRVARAVDRLRQFFADRGVTGVTGAAVAATVLGEVNSAAAAAGGASASLVQSTVNVALLSTSSSAAASSGAAGAIANGVSHMLMLLKLKAAAAAACLGLGVAGVAIAAAAVAAAGPDQPAKPLVQARAVATVAADPADDHPVVKLEGGGEVRFVGLCRAGQDQWHSIAGRKIPEPANPFADDLGGVPAGDGYVLLLHVSTPDALPSVSVRVAGLPGTGEVPTFVLDDGPNASNVAARFTLPEGQASAEVSVLVGAGAWQTVATADFQPGGRGPVKVETPHGAFAVMHVSEFEGGGTVARVATDFRFDEGSWSLFAVDNAGQEVFCDNVWDEPVGAFAAVTYQYSVPADRLAGFAARVRPYEHRVTLKDLALGRDKPTRPRIVVERFDPPAKD